MNKIIFIILIIASVASAWHLRQNTASGIAIFIVDSVDGKTPVETLDINDITAAIYRNGSSTSLTLTAAGGNNDLTGGTNGMYWLELTATDVNTAGQITVVLRDDDVFLPVVIDCQIFPVATYDALYSTGFGDLNTDITQILTILNNVVIQTQRVNEFVR